MTWGNPQRGLASGGTLNMLGGITRAVRQPSAEYVSDRYSYEQTDGFGHTLLQRGPSAAVARTPDELIEDAARGYDWRTDALISGADMDLYGQTIGGFVYCSPDGSRWLIESARLPYVMTEQALSLPLQVRRFGDIHGAPDVRTLTATLADMGQADADPTQSIGDYADLSVCDIQPDGSRALLMLSVPRDVLYVWDYSWENISRQPMGWLELTISGGVAGLTAGLTVVRSRVQTLGVQTYRAHNWTGSGELKTYRETYSTEDFGTYTITTATWLTTGIPNQYLSYERLMLDDEISMVGRILALWYTAAGFDEVTCELIWIATGSHTVPVLTATGQRVVRSEKDGSGSTVLEDTLYKKTSRSGSINVTVDVRLRLNGSVIDEVSGGSTTSLFYEHVYRNPSGLEGITRTETASGSLDGQSGSFVDSSDDAWYLRGANMAPFFYGDNMAQAAVLSSNWGAELYMLDSAGSSVWNKTLCTPRRYSNNLISLAIRSGPYNFAVDGDYEFVHRSGPAAYPGGVHSPGLASGAEYTFYGSYNPATGEVVRDQPEPVCWI